ncbi:amidohydrolase, PncC family [Halopseudomonas xinjiangensis]|uniref:Amidohydrolase, PncC family n=1 Tax=Halopseudomonas xinjiangensis TaxID=487184 RepID=A0A1H1VA35_9GAMM|nr:CinA family protein [Halopseudomonas xinjiangensis]SDS81523.1 amidohydrolase, PncC family [Halopseudomonas xinjiangensis]
MVRIEDVVGFLINRQISVATAESCTAGLMAAMIADVSGVGPAFERGYVVYLPEAKNDMLDVSFETIDEYGLCSEEVAREMALGALRHSNSSMALSNTGAAESDDDDLDGLVCFGCAANINGRERVISETRRFDGSRNEVRRAAARYGLLQLPSYYAQLLEAKPVADGR